MTVVSTFHQTTLTPLPHQETFCQVNGGRQLEQTTSLRSEDQGLPGQNSICFLEQYTRLLLIPSWSCAMANCHHKKRQIEHSVVFIQVKSDLIICLQRCEEVCTCLFLLQNVTAERESEKILYFLLFLALFLLCGSTF